MVSSLKRISSVKLHNRVRALEEGLLPVLQLGITNYQHHSDHWYAPISFHIVAIRSALIRTLNYNDMLSFIFHCTSYRLLVRVGVHSGIIQL